MEPADIRGKRHSSWHGEWAGLGSTHVAVTQHSATCTHDVPCIYIHVYVVCCSIELSTWKRHNPQRFDFQERLTQKGTPLYVCTHYRFCNMCIYVRVHGMTVYVHVLCV